MWGAMSEEPKQRLLSMDAQAVTAGSPGRRGALRAVAAAEGL